MGNVTNSLMVRNLSITYPGNPLASLNQLSLELSVGGWNCILGQSGSGKTTLLKYLAGLLPFDCITAGGLNQTSARYVQDNIAYMAQQDLLLPWLSVLDNVCLEQKIKRQLSKKDAANRARELLVQVGLGTVIYKMPDELSGGMRQRVALARTLIQDKPIVLMDEPFSALDAVTRHQLQALSHQLLQGKTVVLITHDPAEACRLADRIFLLENHTSKISELATPAGHTPRDWDQTSAELQNRIFEQLGANHG